jgi:ankyrin repeat protein
VLHLFLAIFPRGIGGFLGIVIPIALLIVAACLKYIGSKSWIRSLAGSFVGFLCYPLAIGLLLWAFASKQYGELLAWSMLWGFPIILGIALLFLAWLVNVAILCAFGGLKAGLLTGFVVMPILWTLCFGSGFGLLNVYENKRASLDPADALQRGDHVYLEQTTQPGDANALLQLALEYLDPKAAKIAIDKGANVGGSIAIISTYPQSPLQAALEPISNEARSLDKSERAARQEQMVFLLLAHKADPNLVVKPGEAPLLLAIGSADSPTLVTALIDAGARIPENALHLASLSTLPNSTAIVRLLLDKGCDVNARRASDQRTPLQCAAVGLPGTIDLLVQRGASVRPSPLASPDEAPILIAELAGRPDNALELLKLGADPHARTTEGLSAWQLSRDPKLRAALEAAGVPQEISEADLVPEKGDTAAMFMAAYKKNTSIYRIQDVLLSQLRGAGPWDIRVRFPDTTAPVMLKGVRRIEIKDLGADATGDSRNVRNTLVFGEKGPQPGLVTRTFELLEPFSDQVRLGFSVSFTFEKEEPSPNR